MDRRSCCSPLILLETSAIKFGPGSARLARPKRVPSPRFLTDLEIPLFSCTAGFFSLPFLQNDNYHESHSTAPSLGPPLGTRTREPSAVLPLARHYCRSVLLLSNDAEADPPQYTSQDAIRSATPPRSTSYRKRQRRKKIILNARGRTRSKGDEDSPEVSPLVGSLPLGPWRLGRQLLNVIKK